MGFFDHLISGQPVKRDGDARTRRGGEIEATRYLVVFIRYFFPLLRQVDCHVNNV